MKPVRPSTFAGVIMRSSAPRTISAHASGSALQEAASSTGAFSKLRPVTSAPNGLKGRMSMSLSFIVDPAHEAVRRHEGMVRQAHLDAGGAAQVHDALEAGRGE